MVKTVENLENNIKYEDIPKDVLWEISFMLGSAEDCLSEYLKPIIERHGYTDFDFLLINPEDDIELTLDIYKELFLTGKCVPILPENYIFEVIDERLVWESGNCFNLQYHIMETCVDGIPNQNTHYWLMVGNFYNGVLIVENPYKINYDLYDTDVFHCTKQEFCDEFQFGTYEELREECNLDHIEIQTGLMKIINEMRERIKIVDTDEFVKKCSNVAANAPKVWYYKYRK